MEGASLGKTDGKSEGSKLGVLEGGALGATLGASVGCSVVGSMLGVRDGAEEGIKLGMRDGASVVALHSALLSLQDSYAHPLHPHSGARRAGLTMARLLSLVRGLKVATWLLMLHSAKRFQWA